jgi:short-subunit dehydrogenase
VSTGERALVTGASSGFGAVFARRLRARGHRLVLVARREDRLKALQQELGGEEAVVVLPRDLAARDGASGLLRELETRGLEIDLLVNNAGFGLTTPFLEQAVERLHEMVDLNVRAVLELTRGLVPAMVKRGRGAVINVSSIAAFQPVPYMAAYAATKSFILSLTEALAYELKGSGVALQALCPGPTATEFLDVSKTHTGLFVRRMPMLTPEQVVEASLRGLEGGKLRVTPGLANRLVYGLVRVSPRALTQVITAQLFKPR